MSAYFSRATLLYKELLKLGKKTHYKHNQNGTFFRYFLPTNNLGGHFWAPVWVDLRPGLGSGSTF